MNRENLSNIRVVLLSGEEFQRKERLKEILEAVVDPATRDFNLDTITPDSKKKISVETLDELVVTFPMISARRVIVMRDFDTIEKAIRKHACKVIAGTPESTLIIVEGEKAALSPSPPKKYVLSESFKRIYENKLPSWIRGRFSMRGWKVTDGAVALLINNVGEGLRELNNEIEKTTIIAGDSDVVDEKTVEKVVGSFKRHTVWTLCNAVGLGNFGEAVRILENLMASERNKETYYIATLASHIMKIAGYNSLVKKGTPHQEAMKTVTESQFLWNLNKMDRQTGNFGTREIRRALTMLGRTESSLKKSRIDNRLIMELMIPFVMPKYGKRNST